MFSKCPQMFPKRSPKGHQMVLKQSSNSPQTVPKRSLKYPQVLKRSLKSPPKFLRSSKGAHSKIVVNCIQSDSGGGGDGKMSPNALLTTSSKTSSLCQNNIQNVTSHKKHHPSSVFDVV